MKLSEAKEILNKNGYLLEEFIRSDFPPYKEKDKISLKDYDDYDDDIDDEYSDLNEFIKGNRSTNMLLKIAQYLYGRDVVKTKSDAITLAMEIYFDVYQQNEKDIADTIMSDVEDWYRRDVKGDDENYLALAKELISSV